MAQHESKQVSTSEGRLWAGAITHRVYWSDRVDVELEDDGTLMFYPMGEKRDVTYMFEKCASALDWTPPVK